MIISYLRHFLRPVGAKTVCIAAPPPGASPRAINHDPFGVQILALAFVLARPKWAETDQGLSILSPLCRGSSRVQPLEAPKARRSA